MASTFNADCGYFEGLVRGFRAGILSERDYMDLTQCDSLEGNIAHPDISLPSLFTDPMYRRLTFSMCVRFEGALADDRLRQLVSLLRCHESRQPLTHPFAACQMSPLLLPFP